MNQNQQTPGTEEHRVETQRTEVPRIAVIGCGYWGKNLVRNFDALGALVAVADNDPATAAKFGEQYSVPGMTPGAAIDSENIDGVVIAAPAEHHAAIAIRAMEAGKHVFVEKPLALTVAEAEPVVATAKATGRTLMVGHLLQYHPAFLTLKDMVERGDLGDLQYIYSNRLNLGKVRREENALWSFAPHDISMILSLTGEEPSAVSAIGASYLHDVIADVTTTHLTFPGGIQAHVFVSWLHPFKEQKLIIVGSDGMAVFNDGEPWDSKILHYPHKIGWVDGVPTPEKAEAVAVPVPEDEPLKLECAHFLDCIATGTTPRTDGAEGLRVLAVLQAAQESLDKGNAP